MSSGIAFTEEGGGTLDHTRLPTKIAQQQQQEQQQQCCCICGSMRVSQHNSGDRQLYRSQGPIKKAAVIIDRKPQRHSADKNCRTRVMVLLLVLLAGGRSVYLAL